MSNHEELIAEANEWLSESPDAPYHEAVPSNVVGLVSRLTGALKGTTVPTENEREVLVKVMREAPTNPVGHVVLRYEDAADAILAHGFRLPVPVEPETANDVQLAKEDAAELILGNFTFGSTDFALELAEMFVQFSWRKSAPDEVTEGTQ